MAEVISLRPEKEDLKFIKNLAREENVPTSTYLRKLVHEAVKEKRIEEAIEKFKARKLTIREASELAGVSILEFMDEISSLGLMGNFKSSLEEQLTRLG